MSDEASVASWLYFESRALSLKIAPKPFMIGSLGPKALNCESLEGKGWYFLRRKYAGLLASTVDAPELEEAGAFVFAFQVLPLTRNPTK